MVTVDLRTYNEFWQTLKKDINEYAGVHVGDLSGNFAKKFIKERYNVDVHIAWHHNRGVCTMTKKQFVWFVLRWS